MSEWPQIDPITHRKICESCWYGIHRRRNRARVLVDACDGECDCIHRSEETWAAIEKQKKSEAAKERKKNRKAGGMFE